MIDNAVQDPVPIPEQEDHTVEIAQMSTVHIQKRDWQDLGLTRIIDKKEIFTYYLVDCIYEKNKSIYVCLFSKRLYFTLKGLHMYHLDYKLGLASSLKFAKLDHLKKIDVL